MTWTDQPTEVQMCSVVAVGRFDCGAWEVRRDGQNWYLTVGGLFGSQSIRCRDADVLLTLMGRVSRRAAFDDTDTKPLVVPPGAQLLR